MEAAERPVAAAPASPDPDEHLARVIVGLLAPAHGSADDHVLAERHEWPWLPTVDHGHLAQHPYCRNCGGVKYVGSMRAMKRGSLLNLAGQLRESLRKQGHKVTEAQMRLIVRRLDAARADDAFLRSREMQLQLVLQAFSAHTSLSIETLQSYTRSG